MCSKLQIVFHAITIVLDIFMSDFKMDAIKYYVCVSTYYILLLNLKLFKHVMSTKHVNVQHVLLIVVAAIAVKRKRAWKN